LENRVTCPATLKFGKWADLKDFLGKQTARMKPAESARPPDDEITTWSDIP